MAPRAVVVVHQEAIAAEGIAAALSRYASVVPIGVGTTAAEGEERGSRADAVAMDHRLRGAREAGKRLRRKGIRVVFLGEQVKDEGIWVSPRSPISQLASALVPGSTEQESRVSRLTAREREIIELVARGMSGKQVARHLGISPKTVEQHKTRIFAKLGVPNQAAAVRLAVGAGMDRSEAWNQSIT
jgi:DNA-binding CsgD family transcriptional regulator